jgi:hypothetical protein
MVLLQVRITPLSNYRNQSKSFDYLDLETIHLTEAGIGYSMMWLSTDNHHHGFGSQKEVGLK